jgi:hypothetical protein
MNMRAMKKTFCVATVAAIALVAVPTAGDARVVRFEVKERRPVAEGKSFGNVGPYERLDGVVVMEVDPRDPLNAVIVNLENAPKNANGRVEFSAPFFILKPVDMSRGNRKILYGINNRGNKLELARHTMGPLNDANRNNPLSAADIADGLLLRLGYAYVDAGWQGNVAPGNDRLVPTLPVAKQPDGKPIVSRIRVEYMDRNIPLTGSFTLNLEGDAGFVPYPTADTDTSHSTLTVRDSADGAKMPISPDKWAFGSCPDGKASLTPNATHICLFDGFRPERIYELIYPARDPWVMGLGYAVTRDVASFLRYELRDAAGNPNPLASSRETVGIRRAYGAGTSSTGMYMRDWLYLGFNEDEAHRKVFDAVQINIAGTHRLFANVEFSDPNAYSRQDVWHDSLSRSHPPLTFSVTTDPVSGLREGILKRPATDPLVFQLDSGAEFWQMQASLNVHDGRGKAVPVPDNVRLYFAASFDHGGVTGPFSPPRPARFCEHMRQGSDGWPATNRALLIALDEWADRGVAPPKSRYPSIADGTLVSLAAAARAFPKIPNVTFPAVLNELSLPDFGPHFGPTGGRLTKVPPTLGARYQVMVPKTDSDGLDVGGIRAVEVAVPVATLTGWNMRAAGHRRPELCELNGAYIPFAKTKAEREQRGDPRPSLAERYGDHAGYVKAVAAATRQLVAERFLLQEDADRYVEAAKASDVLR